MKNLQSDDRRTGRQQLKKSTLSPERRRLVERMQGVGHGRIENLVMRGCEPQWSPPPDVIRDVIIGERAGPHPKRQQADFGLKDHLAKLFEDFDHAQDGARYSIAIRDGLPVRFSVKEPYSD